MSSPPLRTGAGAAVELLLENMLFMDGYSRGDDSAGFSVIIFVPLSMLSKSGLGVCPMPPDIELRDYYCGCAAGMNTFFSSSTGNCILAGEGWRGGTDIDGAGY